MTTIKEDSTWSIGHHVLELVVAVGQVVVECTISIKCLSKYSKLAVSIVSGFVQKVQK